LYPAVALSRDGTRLVYVASGRLYLKEMSELKARPIGGIDARAGVPMGHPVFSPDGQWIAFYTAANRLEAGSIKKVPIGGGVPLPVWDNVRFDGMSWDEGGIIFAQREAGIMRVAPEGGTPELLVAVDKGEVAQAPRMLPNGKGVLFAVVPDLPLAVNPDLWDKADIVVQSVGSRDRQRVLQGGNAAHYLSSGHLVVARGGTLLAAPFNLDRLETTGGAVPVVTGVTAVTGAVATQAAISDSGALAYIEGLSSVGSRYEVTFIDRRGVVEPLKLPETASYVFPRLSPDGKQIALGTDDGREARLWIYDVSGTNAPRQLTLGGNSRYPLWSSDGTTVAFQNERDGSRSIFRQRADGTAPAEQLTTAAPKSAHVPESWSPDGRHVLFNVIGGFSLRRGVLAGRQMVRVRLARRGESACGLDRNLR
jgi:Tol biopolymer transport system component